MCLYPKLIKNGRYTANKKNGGIIPPVSDVRTLYVPIGCTKCIECRKQKANGWRTRMLEDIRENRNGIMVTLTLSDEKYTEIANECGDIKGYTLDNTIATRAVKLFLERWRKRYKKSIRHWLVTELGHNGTENVHLHGIVWTDEPREKINEIWGYGYTWFGHYVNEATVNYSVKYVTKIDIKHQQYKPIVLTSAGIGSNYTKSSRAKENKYQEGKTNEGYRTRTGHKTALAIYWRNKIYNENEREKLWIEKINKEERWILGQRISISKRQNEYWELLQEARERNNRLGYGNEQRNWEREAYEEKIRIIMQETRRKRAEEKTLRGSIQKGMD